MPLSDFCGVQVADTVEGNVKNTEELQVDIFRVLNWRNLKYIMFSRYSLLQTSLLLGQYCGTAHVPKILQINQLFYSFIDFRDPSVNHAAKDSLVHLVKAGYMIVRVPTSEFSGRLA